MNLFNRKKFIIIFFLNRELFLHPHKCESIYIWYCIILNPWMWLFTRWQILTINASMTMPKCSSIWENMRFFHHHFLHLQLYNTPSLYTYIYHIYKNTYLKNCHWICEGETRCILQLLVTFLLQLMPYYFLFLEHATNTTVPKKSTTKKKKNTNNICKCKTKIMWIWCRGLKIFSSLYSIYFYKIFYNNSTNIYVSNTCIYIV